jgi:hypothetical protein
MKIVLAGDSYSDVQDFRTRPVAKPEYFAWSDEICKRFSAACVAQYGASMWNIWQQTKSLPWDLLIVNMTGLVRFSQEIDWTFKAKRLKINEPTLIKHNKQFVKRIVQLPCTYCWSPFPEYADYPGVEWINLEHNDELWWVNHAHAGDIEARPHHLITGNHLTRKGNEWMINHITQKIEERL